MKHSAKLLLGFLLVLGIAAIALFLSLRSAMNTAEGIKKVARISDALRLAKEIDAKFQLAVSKAKNFALLQDRKNAEIALQQYSAAKDALRKLESLQQDAEHNDFHQEIEGRLAAVEPRIQALIDNAAAGDSPSDLYNRYLKDITLPFEVSVDRYIAFLDRQAKEIEKQELKTADYGLYLTFAAGLVVMVFGIMFSTSFSLAVSRPLEQLAGAVARAAAGDANIDIKPAGDDETKQIADSVRNMSKQLRESAQAVLEWDRFFRLLLDMVCIIGFDGRIKQLNEAWTNRLGFEPEELKEMSLIDLAHPDDKEATRAEWNKVKTGANVTSFENRYLRKDGSYISLVWNATPLVEQEIVYAVCHDVTERKLAEEALRKSEERLRLALDSAQMGTWEWNVLTNEVVWSEQAETVFGLGHGGFSGTFEAVMALIHPEDLATVRSGISLCFEGKQPDYEIEHRVILPDGSVRWIEGKGRAYWNGAGEPVRMAGTVVDITKRKTAEEAHEQLMLNIEKGISADRGKTFFPSLVKYLAKALEADYAFVGEVMKENPDRIRTIAVCINGEAAENFEYDLINTPCKNVLEQSMCIYPSGALESFPEDYLLADMGVEGYAGTPLYDSNGQALGLLVALFRRPVADASLAKSLLQIFGVRASAELERKRAEQALLESEERFRRLSEAAFEGIGIHEKGTVIDANTRLAEMLGFEASEIIGKPVTNLVAQESLETVTERLRARSEEAYEHLAKRKDGSIFPVEVRGKNLPYEGRTVRVTAIRDVTDRKQAEEALKQSELRFRSLIENASDIITVIDKDGVISYESPSMERALGYEPKELSGRTTFKFIHPEDVQIVRNALAAGMQNPSESQTVEYRIKHKDGSWHTFESVGNNFLNNSAVAGAIINSRDITERKRAEEERERLQDAITKSAMEWRMTFDAVESPILLLDLNGKISRVNIAAKELLERDYSDIINRQVEALGDDRLWQKVAEVASLVKQSSSVAPLQVKNEITNKTWEITASLASDDESDNIWIILVLRDISRTVKLQESLRRSELMSAMGSLVAGVAHEVRNPLFAVMATLDAFEASFEENEQYKEYLNVLRKELYRMVHLMQDLLEYGKPPHLEFAPSSIEEVISESIRQCEILSKQSNVAINNNIKDELPTLLIDKDRMIHVFTNLIENAVQHTPYGEAVTLEAARIRFEDEDWIKLIIKDRGEGFQPADLSKVFEPFFTRRRGGTGLGLSIAQRIVEEHGGKIFAGNLPDGGAVMTVQFPFAAND